MECWRLLIDAANPKPTDQFPGWPKTMRIPITMAGTDRTSAEHRDHGDEEPGHSGQGLRGETGLCPAIRSNSYRPPVFDKEATYEVRVGEPDRELWKTLKPLKADKQGSPSSRIVKF